jgi:acyl-CoA thioesterase-1
MRRPALILLPAFLAFAMVANPARAAPGTIVAFGDSFFSGYGLEPGEGFPDQLERVLHKNGHDVRVVNEGADGETITEGLKRVERIVAQKPTLILLELGANDAELGIDPAVSQKNLDRILRRIQAAHIPVVLCGAEAPADFGGEYQAKFSRIYTDLAAKYGVSLYPYIMDGIASDPRLMQDDGEHPNLAGVKLMVERMLPFVTQIIH